MANKSLRFTRLMAAIIPTLFLTALLDATPLVVSNVSGRVLSCDSAGSFYRWTIEAAFDLSGDDTIRYRIWPGLRNLEPKRVLPDEGFYFNYTNVSGDTSIFPGRGYKIRFTAKDTCRYDSVHVKITAWDREGWPPFPNRNFFERHHGLGLDIRKAPAHSNSLNFLNFFKTHSEPSPTSNFNIGHVTYGVFRVMGDHPKKRLVKFGPYCYYPDTSYPVPFPSVALGDPSEPPMAGCTGDCHLAIVDVENWWAYEFFKAQKLPSGIQDWSGSPAIYNLNLDTMKYKVPISTPFGASVTYQYRPIGNGSNVSGMSFSGWTVKPDEILDGEIQHAVGFNWWYQADYFVYPATHGGADYSPQPNWPPIGLRLRLKPGFDIIGRTAGSTDTTMTKAVRVLLRCFQKYGIINTQTAGDDHTLHLLGEDLPGSSFETLISPRFPTILRALNLDLTRDFEVVDWNWQVQQYEKYPKDRMTP